MQSRSQYSARLAAAVDSLILSASGSGSTSLRGSEPECGYRRNGQLQQRDDNIKKEDKIFSTVHCLLLLFC